MKRYGAYHRVSDANGRDLDAETTITDKEAFEQIDAWARTRPGVTIADRYLDWDQSGSSMERPELERLLADLEAGEIDGVVVAQVDRLSRAEVGDALATVKRIAGDDPEAPRPLVLLDLGIDPSTEFGEFGLTILLGLARMQWRRYKRQYAAAQRRATSRGVWIGPAPLGYRRGKGGELLPDGPRGRVVREAFELAARDGLGAADEYLAQHVPGRRRHVSDTRRLLANRAYLGEHHAGGPEHEPLTTAAAFAAAQTESRGRRSNGAYPLSHVATCANCGAGLVGALQTVRGRKYRRMRCSAMTGAGCVGSVGADQLEGLVRDQLGAALGDRAFRVGFDAGDVEGAQAQLERAERERRRFAEDTEARELLGDEDWRAGLRARSEKVAEARAGLQAIAAQSARSQQLPGPAELEDPRKFAAALAVVGRLAVRGGRGPIGERVALDWVGIDDSDDRAGVLAA